MYKQRRVATSVELELFFIGIWWILSLGTPVPPTFLSFILYRRLIQGTYMLVVGNGIYSTNLDWNNCDSSKLCM